ncbi:YicC/YloC family endoribonuclease [Geopsychrobacter electrodiphilus]|uniref:YicC/YloC family endoribonuclease n=1 Tax=Geopsychrobacter electrodiphilus TaxID=225196 RepID=UPI0003728F4E|nr:YicC/YloC family endoribonuclease [Geopsychrobacter electrodiphilus]
MIRSMTGYGRGQGKANGLIFSAEIRAVNHRYGDINIKAPRLLFPFEAEVKKQVATVLKRGKIDVFVIQETSEDVVAVPVLNRAVARGYVELFNQMRTEFNLSGDIPLELLAAQKDVLIVRENAVDEGALRDALQQAVCGALTGMLAMREAEGEATQIDIRARLGLIRQSLEMIASRAAQVPLEWQQKLKERLQRLADDAVDEQRLAQELVLFADRCDISEELSRFQSHLQQLDQLFSSLEPVGRQMDFLIQELNRETNTMGSKSNDADLTRNVVAIKAELEKIREQVQNIE